MNVRVEVGNIALQDVGAVVNPANRAMRGDAGTKSVEGAIYAASGPRLLDHVRRAFPRWLPVGAAAVTPGFDLAAKHIVHIVVPTRQTKEDSSEALVAAYKEALRAASEAEAKTIALPILGAGFNRWTFDASVRAAIEALSAPPSGIAEVVLVVKTEEDSRLIDRLLSEMTGLRLLQGVGILHRRGFEQVGVLPGISPNGSSWRLAIASMSNCEDFTWERPALRVVRYGTAGGSEVNVWENDRRVATHHVNVFSTPEETADLILAALGSLEPAACPSYAIWYAALLSVCEGLHALPVSYAEFYERDGWEIVGYPDAYGGEIVFTKPPKP